MAGSPRPHLSCGTQLQRVQGDLSFTCCPVAGAGGDAAHMQLRELRHASLPAAGAEQILDRALKVKEYELKKVNFSSTGCFGFGITEHIDLGIKYDPASGIFGMDFYVVLSRPGLHVSKRKYRPGRIGNHHKVSKIDAIKWFREKYEGLVL